MDESKKVEERQQFWSVRNARQMTSLRSTQQYYSWKNQLGFFIHPKVEINVEPDQLSIADIGTGTGTWLFDLAKKLHPPVKLHGFDIDTSLAPPPAWLPENVTIQAVENYTDKFPTHLTQAYDIVHVSNIASSIKDNNPGAVIKNIMTMLKPNGYIQWQEPDTAHRRILPGVGLLPLSPQPPHHLNTLLRFLENEEARLSPRGWIDSLPDIFSRYGLEVPAVRHRYRMPDAYVRAETDRFLLEMEDFAVGLDGEGGKREEEGEEKGKGEVLRVLLELAREECERDGVGLRVDIVVAVARKGE